MIISPRSPWFVGVVASAVGVTITAVMIIGSHNTPVVSSTTHIVQRGNTTTRATTANTATATTATTTSSSADSATPLVTPAPTFAPTHAPSVAPTQTPIVCGHDQHYVGFQCVTNTPATPTPTPTATPTPQCPGTEAYYGNPPALVCRTGLYGRWYTNNGTTVWGYSYSVPAGFSTATIYYGSTQAGPAPDLTFTFSNGFVAPAPVDGGHGMYESIFPASDVPASGGHVTITGSVSGGSCDPTPSAAPAGSPCDGTILGVS